MAVLVILARVISETNREPDCTRHSGMNSRGRGLHFQSIFSRFLRKSAQALMLAASTACRCSAFCSMSDLFHTYLYCFNPLAHRFALFAFHIGSSPWLERKRTFGGSATKKNEHVRYVNACLCLIALVLSLLRGRM